MVTRFLETGCAELDTAYIYAEGKTEEVLGPILARLPREQFRIATKANPSVKGNLRPESVTEQLETSLGRLGLASVDLFYLHQPDLSTPIETTLEACARLFERRLFRELGLSNYAA